MHTHDLEELYIHLNRQKQEKTLKLIKKITKVVHSNKLVVDNLVLLPTIANPGKQNWSSTTNGQT